MALIKDLLAKCGLKPSRESNVKLEQKVGQPAAQTTQYRVYKTESGHVFTSPIPPNKDFTGWTIDGKNYSGRIRYLSESAHTGFRNSVAGGLERPLEIYDPNNHTLDYIDIGDF